MELWPTPKIAVKKAYENRKWVGKRIFLLALGIWFISFFSVVFPEMLKNGENEKLTYQLTYGEPMPPDTTPPILSALFGNWNIWIVSYAFTLVFLVVGWCFFTRRAKIAVNSVKPGIFPPLTGGYILKLIITSIINAMLKKKPQNEPPPIIESVLNSALMHSFARIFLAFSVLVPILAFSIGKTFFLGWIGILVLVGFTYFYFYSWRVGVALGERLTALSNTEVAGLMRIDEGQKIS
ncbi:MAG: hypothetical protein V1835_00600 [Candidatus Micrarchaeota archaeon]